MTDWSEPMSTDTVPRRVKKLEGTENAIHNRGIFSAFVCFHSHITAISVLHTPLNAAKLFKVATEQLAVAALAS